uniref:NADH dehydrogenase subunit 6 n=1 Tax=Paraleius leontonychus TaxID=1807943 RepID=A0A330JLI4_9ACAR|nr:NADH dehydrogenase subunit 6 [Paraleius leontonychus]
MTTAAMVLMMKTLKSMNPTKYAFLILTCSLVTSAGLFKISTVSWMPLTLIMIFSSGMMTLFIYVSSLAPNEKSKSSHSWMWALLLVMSMSPKAHTLSTTKQSMKTFSHQTLILIMTAILILTMLAISSQSFNPQQTMSSTF